MIGIVADDITGAGDIGIMYAKAGLAAHVYPYGGDAGWTARIRGHACPDALVLDTNSRLDDAATAYRKVRMATLALQELGARRYFNKTCSVFRGNIGAEFDAMLDALGESFAVIVLGFPKNGRTTLHGVHYVRGVRLEESEFKQDPVHPMRESDLAEILQRQTKRKVDRLDCAVVDRGEAAIRSAIEEKRGSCAYLIADVRDQQSLRELAKAIIAANVRVICGSSGIAEELAPLERASGPKLAGVRPRGAIGSGAADRTGILCAAGSLMPQTKAQVADFQAHHPVVRLDTVRLFGEGKAALADRLVQELANNLRSGNPALLAASNSPEEVEATKRIGSEQGMDDTEVSRLVSGTIAEIVRRSVRETGCRRLLIAGGETSAAVCRSLNVDGMQVVQEIEPGLPACLSLDEPRLALVLKSGSFGSPEFFRKALGMLESMEVR